ncbi:MAG: hypothetical protein PVF54_08950, partial [Anaerolineae bacterium]
MPTGGSESFAHGATAASIEPRIAMLRVAGGAILDNAAPLAATFAPPAQARRGRRNQHLFYLFDPAGAATPDLCRQLCDVVTQTYWSTGGSVTAALRRAASLANRYLFEYNLNAEPSNRCYGGLSCAVLRDNDLFLLEAGPSWACVLHGEQLRCFPSGEKLAHMGIGPVADARLDHVFAVAGDTLLLAPGTLLADVGEEGLLRILPHDKIDSVVAEIRQLGTSANFAALAVRCELSSRDGFSQARSLAQARRSAGASLAPAAEAQARKVGESVEQVSQVARQEVVEPPLRASGQRPTRGRREPGRGSRILGKALRSGLHYVGRALSYLWHGVAAVGAGLFALGRWIAGAMGRSIRATLPGGRREAYQRVPRHPPPEEDRKVMAAVAVAILILIVAGVLMAYLNLAAESRFEVLIRRAEERIALAQAAGADSESARVHWEEALRRIDAAGTLQPEDSSTEALREQVLQALDQLDRIERLTLTQLVDFGSSNVERRLLLQGQTLFVLDSRDGWGARVPVARVGNEPGGGKDVVLVHTGQRVGGDDVGQLVDHAWVDRQGGRHSSALLVLEEGSRLVSYDPAWGDESGAPQLTRLELGSPRLVKPVAVGSYEGQFYVLDAAAENGGQIWRYKPQGNA